MQKINIKKILHIFFLAILAVLFIASIYLRIEYADESVEEFYFYLKSGVGDSDASVFLSAILVCIGPLIALTMLFVSLFYDVTCKMKKKLPFYPFKFLIKHRIIFTIVLSVIVLALSLNNIKCFEYIYNNIHNSDYIKENYQINDVTFPKKKRNLITIYVESLETTLFTKEQGGDWDYPVIPELYDLLNEPDAIYFASDDLANGEYNLVSTTWTTASLVANNTGLPFKIPIGRNEYHSKQFMNGSVALGDILESNGYHNELISAAKTSFGGVKDFYTNHGNYEIVDIKSLKNYGYETTEDDLGKWGFNDRYMFEIAKDRLTKVSKEKAPFNMSIVGIDTHFRDGYKGVYTIDKYDTQYENVYATEAILISDFVKWIKEQPFYENTTIVILGDHTSMQTNYFRKYDKEKRRRYNVFINSAVTTENTKNRIFTAVDMFPTQIASIGGIIKEDQLGLGVNLFSDKLTLAERDGFEKLNKECSRKSNFYNLKILGNDYKKMTKKKKVK